MVRDLHHNAAFAGNRPCDDMPGCAGMKSNLQVWVCCSVIIAVGSFAGAGSRADEAPRQSVDDATIERLRKLHYSETEEVRLVLLPTSVTDRKGRMVRDLRRRDFQLFEDETPQQIRYFSFGPGEPVSVAFLLDISGSMRQLDKLDHAKAAIRHMVDGMREEDRAGLICFADEQVDWVTEFTGERRRFLRRLDVQEGYGQTALNDAVAAAPNLVDERIQGRKAIVLVTDGVDNFSRFDPEGALELARRVNVPIYTIGFLSTPPSMLPKRSLAERLSALQQFSEETGGRLFPVYDPAELKEAVAALDAELRHQYVIGYSPMRSGSDGAFHSIRLEASPKRLTVRTRSGYYDEP